MFLRYKCIRDLIKFYFYEYIYLLVILKLQIRITKFNELGIVQDYLIISRFMLFIFYTQITIRFIFYILKHTIYFVG